jgi:hypothetical protein
MYALQMLSYNVVIMFQCFLLSSPMLFSLHVLCVPMRSICFSDTCCILVQWVPLFFYCALISAHLINLPMIVVNVSYVCLVFSYTCPMLCRCFAGVLPMSFLHWCLMILCSLVLFHAIPIRCLYVLMFALYVANHFPWMAHGVPIFGLCHLLLVNRRVYIYIYVYSEFAKYRWIGTSQIR